MTPEQPAFEGVKEWPDAPPPAGHNQPPLEASLLSEFEEAIAVKGLAYRIQEIMDAAKRAPEVADDESAGAVGDLIAMGKEAHKAVEAEREVLNRPLLNAQRALKGKADSLLVPMEAALDGLRPALNAYMAERSQPAHGDMGARVGTRTDYDFKIVDAGKLPLSIRRHPAVIEAMEKVIRALIKSGERKIAGVQIFPATKATVR